MIDPQRIAEVERLLAAGNLSQRKIALAMGISRGTVSGVATGRRRPRVERPDDELLTPAGPPQRCACGALVYMPCVACRTRAAHATKLPPDEPADLDAFDLKLKPAEQARYKRVREARQAGHELSSFALLAEDEIDDQPDCADRAA